MSEKRSASEQFSFLFNEAEVYKDRSAVQEEEPRKNFLFANTPGSTQGSTVVFSMIETAKENEFDPYRPHILQTAPMINLEQDVQRLLPWNVHLNN